MNILWINHRDPKHPAAGGAEVRILELSKRLRHLGWRIDLIAERPPGLPATERIGPLNVYRYGGRISVHLYSLLHVLLKSNNYDIIIDDIAHAVPWHSEILSRAPVIAQIHHVHQEVLHYELSPWKASLLALAERSMRLTYKAFITVSKSTKKMLTHILGINPKRIAVIPNGVDTRKYTPGPKSSKPMILWLGRMKKYKRIHHTLAAFKLVKKQVKDAVLVAAGTGDASTIARRTAKRLGLREGTDIIFTGRVSEEEKIRLLQQAWVLVTTSLIEGWGLTTTEAAACGTPTIAYRVPGIIDAVINGATGLLAPDGDIHRLAHLITLVLRDDELRARLSRNARRYAERLDWDNIALHLDHLLKRLAEGW